MKALRVAGQRPWLFALVAGAGATLLFPSALSLLLPTDLLARVAAFGDGPIAAGLGLLFAVATGSARVWLRPGRFSDEELLAVERKPAATPHTGDDAPRPWLR